MDRGGYDIISKACKNSQNALMLLRIKGQHA